MVVVIIGILAAIAIPKFANSKERAIISQMRSDLRNMVTAQEAYISDALTYYNGPIPSAGVLAYDPSGNITITLSGVSATGWAAVAGAPTSSRTCAIFMGTAPPPPPSSLEGVIACTP
jgi:type II secretory pathway pseudopilin PulG